MSNRVTRWWLPVIALFHCITLAVIYRSRPAMAIGARPPSPNPALPPGVEMMRWPPCLGPRRDARRRQGRVQPLLGGLDGALHPGLRAGRRWLAAALARASSAAIAEESAQPAPCRLGSPAVARRASGCRGVSTADRGRAARLIQMAALEQAVRGTECGQLAEQRLHVRGRARRVAARRAAASGRLGVITSASGTGCRVPRQARRRRPDGPRSWPPSPGRARSSAGAAR